MNIFLNTSFRPLSLQGAATLRVKRPGWLRLQGGHGWLTRSGVGGDQIVAPGAWLWVEPSGTWVIEAWHPAGPPVLLEWHAMPSRGLPWRAMLQRWREDFMRPVSITAPQHCSQ